MTPMKKVSTLFLKAALCFIALATIALCIFALPFIRLGASENFPMVANALLLIMLGLYATAVPFFIALWQAFKLLTYIDKNTAFSDLSVKAIRNIKRSGIVISALYIAGVPLLFPIADVEDAPGMILIGAAIASIPVVVTVFAAVLEMLLHSAIEMKSENELTV